MKRQKILVFFGTVSLLSGLSGCVKGTYEDYRYSPGVYGPGSFTSYPYSSTDEYLYSGGTITFDHEVRRHSK